MNTAPTGKHFAVLDGLRGIAVLTVVLSHLSLLHVNPFPVDFAGIGKCGVYLFFVLSAFLLTYQFFEKGVQGAFTAPALANYFWRRALRVLPLFYLVVLVSGITTRFFAADLGGAGLPYTMTLREMVAHFLLLEGIGVLWSVPVEFKFYFLLPLIAGGFLLTGRKGVGWDVILAVGLIALLHHWFPATALNLGTVDLRYFLAVFVIGSLCASIAFKVPFDRHPRVASALAWTIAAVLILTVPSIYSAVIRPVPAGYFQKSLLLYAILWAVFLYMALHAEGWLRSLLTSRLLVFLGRISFSVYLLHFPVLRICHAVAPGSRWIGALAFVLVLGLATASYRLIERPLSRIRMRDVGRLMRLPSAA